MPKKKAPVEPTPEPEEQNINVETFLSQMIAELRVRLDVLDMVNQGEAIPEEFSIEALCNLTLGSTASPINTPEVISVVEDAPEEGEEEGSPEPADPPTEEEDSTEEEADFDPNPFEGFLEVADVDSIEFDDDKDRAHFVAKWLETSPDCPAKKTIEQLWLKKKSTDTVRHIISLMINDHGNMVDFDVPYLHNGYLYCDGQEMSPVDYDVNEVDIAADTKGKITVFDLAAGTSTTVDDIDENWETAAFFVSLYTEKVYMQVSSEDLLLVALS